VGSLLAQVEWSTPEIDYHALAPEIILGVGIFVLLLLEVNLGATRKWITSAFSGLVVLLAMLPIITLAVDDVGVRSLFDGRYVVDEFSLVLKMLFLVAAYVVVLLSTTYVEEGDYYEGEYYLLLLSSVLGMVMMASSRDLVTIFVSLELLSIPAYMLAAWRKRDVRSNEAGMKYFLLGVFASALMLYGMSLLYGVTGSTKLVDIGAALTGEGAFAGVETLAVVFIVVGFAFKVSAVPFHSWAPDVYEGAPTPVTAFLSVASKAAGFVALLVLVYIAFPAMSDVWEPFLMVLAALSMTVGNVLALKQTNMVRMLAYSSVSQGGFVLMALAVAGNDKASESAMQAVITYLLVYAAMNLGAFAIVLAVSRRTRSGEISSYVGLCSYAPGLGVLMTIFLASLAGIPPLGGWIAKFLAFKAVVEAGTGAAWALAIIGAVNSVIAFGYYGNVLREIWMRPVPAEVDAKLPMRTPTSLVAALGITGAATVALGVLPALITRFGDLSNLTGALGR
jgi:NADH-quinone oxidoreductase subunit N